MIRKNDNPKIILDILQSYCIITDKYTGEVRLHIAEGSLVAYEAVKKGKFKDLATTTR